MKAAFKKQSNKFVLRSIHQGISKKEVDYTFIRNCKLKQKDCRAGSNLKLNVTIVKGSISFEEKCKQQHHLK